MVKTCSILMIAVLGIAMFGLYPALKLVQYHAAEEMAERLEHNLPVGQLTAFQDLQNNKECNWEETNKEFHYKGTMYDVVRIEQKNGHSIYYCLSDKNEAAAYTQIQKLVSAQQNGDVNRNTQKLFKLFIQVFTPGERYRHDAYCMHDVYTLVSNHYSCHYSGSFTKIVAPPPKAC